MSSNLTAPTIFFPSREMQFGRCQPEVEAASGLQPATVVNFLNANFLFASLIWSSIGVGYFIYGKRQQSWVPWVGGVAMIAVSCLVPSALLMSLLCLVLMAAVHVLVRQGW
ncbi:MAG: hypothetical protein EXS33_08935 [Pedosphaera sp.]|nr:hypothetical protein [Pedosphaera sp.]